MLSPEMWDLRSGLLGLHPTPPTATVQLKSLVNRIKGSTVLFIFQHFGKYSYWLSFQELDKKIHINFMSVCGAVWILELAGDQLSLAQHRGQKQEETTSVSLFKVMPLKLTRSHVSHLFDLNKNRNVNTINCVFTGSLSVQLQAFTPKVPH